MKLSLSLAQKLLMLLNGEELPAGKLKYQIIDDLLQENILSVSGKSRKKIKLINTGAFNNYLASRFQINSLQKYIDILKKEEIKRADLVEVSGSSKTKQIRSFKGFLINFYTPLRVKLNNQTIELQPVNGAFHFIYDFENLLIDEHLTIVGIENPENFRFVHQQQYLFRHINPLFVSRYPQNQSKDLIKWLQSIPNKYLHFGDFDLAGISIYLNEYKKYLKEKAQFFIPEHIENLIIEQGNRDLYDKQRINLPQTGEKALDELINIIHKYRKALEQEFFIGK